MLRCASRHRLEEYAISLSTQQFEAAIAQIDVRLSGGARVGSLYVDRGQLLEMLGRKDEAVQAYIDALRIEPAHVEALNGLGLLCMAAGNRAAARTILSGAVLHGPLNAAAHANLAYLYALDNQLTGARKLYEHALVLDPRLAIAHHGLAEVLRQLGDELGSADHRALGLRYRPITIDRYIGEGQPIRVLALGTAALGNIPTAGYFDNHVFLLASVTVDYADPNVPLPPHDVVFNAIGEADLCRVQLATAAAIVGRTNAPVINHPNAVAATNRVANARRLRELEGVVTSRIGAYAREQLSSPIAETLLPGDGFVYPLLVRSPGYHTGDHFSKVDHFADLSGAIDALPGADLLVIEYMNLQDARACFRKYRVIIVNGKLYPLHLAVSLSWKVHYFSALMAESAEYRAEDAAFLSDMPGVLGANAVAALERVRVTLGLDFGGIDFALNAAGGIIVFEANASMIVPSPGNDAVWNYRRAPTARIRAAVREMLVERAARHTRAHSTTSARVAGPMTMEP